VKEEMSGYAGAMHRCKDMLAIDVGKILF